MIPAKMGSSRFPGKPPANILDMLEIDHAYRRTTTWGDLQEVDGATCDSEIREVGAGFRGKVIITSSSHQRASDRGAEQRDYLVPPR